MYQNTAAPVTCPSLHVADPLLPDMSEALQISEFKHVVGVDLLRTSNAPTSVRLMKASFTISGGS